VYDTLQHYGMIRSYTHQSEDSNVGTKRFTQTTIIFQSNQKKKPGTIKIGTRN
jgi:hypothetical protein